MQPGSPEGVPSPKIPCARVDCTSRPEWLPTVGGYIIANLPLCTACRLRVRTFEDLPLDDDTLSKLPNRAIGWVALGSKRGIQARAHLGLMEAAKGGSA